MIYLKNQNESQKYFLQGFLRLSRGIMKRFLLFYVFILLLFCSITACESGQIFGPTNTATSTITLTPTPTATSTPTLTPTQTSTPAPILISLMNEAKLRDMFVVLIFTPNFIIDEYYDIVADIEEFSAKDLLEPINPNLYYQIESSNIYKDYFRVILVGNPNCGGLYHDHPEHEKFFCFFPLIDDRQTINVYGIYDFGDYFVSWQPSENQICIITPDRTWCPKGHQKITYNLSTSKFLESVNKSVN